ncbi:hypothetical protein HDV57DRAFT_147555 [Trichoderma longibrachiatum]
MSAYHAVGKRAAVLLLICSLLYEIRPYVGNHLPIVPTARPVHLHLTPFHGIIENRPSPSLRNILGGIVYKVV